MATTNEKSPWILDADEATFQQAVVERSRETLVIIDFWAQWCQPCRMLGPILEKLATEYNGQFLLVKAETEKVPNIAGAFGVQSIPAVYAMRDGQLLDYFVGLLSEDQIRAFIDRLQPSEAEKQVSDARKLEATEPAAAEAKYLEAARLDPNLPAAKIGLAGLLLAQDRTDESRSIIDELEKRGYLEPEAEKIKAQLNLSAQADSTGDLQGLRAAVVANPSDLSAKLQLAEALAAQGDYEPALETALQVVESAKKEFVEPARKLMIDVFRMLPDDSEALTTYRRRLSTALY